eukprot:12925825-Prorocentrum_lima.AAC.1
MSAHARGQQRAQEPHLRALNEEFHREQVRSRTTVGIMEEGNSSLKSGWKKCLCRQELPRIKNTKEPFEPG